MQAPIRTNNGSSSKYSATKSPTLKNGQPRPKTPTKSRAYSCKF